MAQKEYLFKSSRLGFRDWQEEDLDAFAEMNADPEVMAYFPQGLTREETRAYIKRLQKQFRDRGYTYFATEVLKTGDFIGFIGLGWQDYQAPFTPATDIGWRLKREAWGKGYATEGARRCLGYAFETLHLERVVAVCPVLNKASERVMQKSGMALGGTFLHPGLADTPRLQPCLWYEQKNPYLQGS